MSWLFSSGLGLRDAHLAQLRGVELHDAELRDVAAELVQALHRPGRHQPRQPAPGDPVLVLEQLAEAHRVEQAERRLEDRADLVAGLQDVDRLLLHEDLQPLGQGRLAAADRAEEVEDLLALLQPLGGMAEIADDPFDRLLHAVELGECRVPLDRAVHEDAAEPGVAARVEDLGLADRLHQAFGSACVQSRIVPASHQIGLQARLLVPLACIGRRECVEHIQHGATP